MNTEDFEKRLQRQSLRPVPPEWKSEILQTAARPKQNGWGAPAFLPARWSQILQSAAATIKCADAYCYVAKIWRGWGAGSPGGRQDARPTTGRQDACATRLGWFWPCPQAWVGLAAIWLAILALNFGSSGTQKTAMPEPIRPSREMATMLKEQWELRAELLGIAQEDPAEPPKPTLPIPQSERIIANSATV